MEFFVCLAFLTVVLLLIYHAIIKEYATGGVCTSKATMAGKTAIITGANAGIGKATAIDMAQRGARVIMACRDLKRGEAALKDVVEETGSKEVVLKQLDLASLKSVRKFAEDINKNEPELHVLINNAGLAYPPKQSKTEDGFELTMGVNYLGHFLLTNLLLDLLKKTAPSRIVVVASSVHHQLTKEFKFDNIHSEKFYDHWDTYGQSKLACILFTRELAKRLEGKGVTINALHPGVITTELVVNFMNRIGMFFIMVGMRFLSKTPEQGAQTTIHLAVSKEVKDVSGLYFSDCALKEPSKYAQDDGVAKKLWEVSSNLVVLDRHL
jgi:NAD(P)-dependent dehydrogenase (short-subunit alcohol dehydrogenase family)